MGERQGKKDAKFEGACVRGGRGSENVFIKTDRYVMHGFSVEAMAKLPVKKQKMGRHNFHLFIHTFHLPFIFQTHLSLTWNW